MPLEQIEDNGFYSLFVDTESKQIYVEDQDDNIIALKKGSKGLKDTSTSWKLSAVEEFENSITLIKDKYDEAKKELLVYKFNSSGKYKNAKIYKSNSYKYYELESITGYDYDDDGIAGLAFEVINDYGDQDLYKDNFGYVAVQETESDEDDYEHITFKNKKIKWIKSGWSSVAASTANGENIVVQTNEKNNTIKKLYNQGSDWNLDVSKLISENDDDYYDLEVLTNKDFNADGWVGFKLITLEEEGSKSTYTNEKGELLVDSSEGYSNLIYKGLKVNSNQFKAQEIFGSDVVDGNNFVVWKHVSGNLIKWNMNEEWEFNSSDLAIYQSYEYYLLESFLEQDADGDGENGLNASSFIDSDGSIYLAVDNADNIYYYQLGEDSSIDDLNSEDFNPLYYKGNQLTSSGFSDYAIIGMEEINSEYFLALESNNGDLKKYLVNETGHLDSYTKVTYQTSDYFNAEEDFDQDFDGDNITGFSFDDAFDSVGNVEMMTDQVDNIYAKSDSIIPVKYQNNQVKESQFSGLTMLGGETDADTNINYIAWEEDSTEKLSIWSLDKTWNYKSYDNITLDSEEYYESENFFLQDFNGDSIVGYSYTDIEVNGLTTLKADNQLGIAYADYTTVEMESANYFGGFSIKNSTNAITYKGSKVKEDSFTEQFGLYLLGAETYNNQQLVAWADGDKNLTIWQTDENWDYSSSLEVQYNSTTFLEYETIFDQDWNDDDTVGSQETIIENNKFVTTQVDQLGNVFLTISDTEYAVKNNNQQVNINDIWWDTSLDENKNGSYELLASETNLWKNQVHNQIAWGFFDDVIDELNKIAIWNMNDDWTDIESIDIIDKYNQDDSVVDEYKLLELSFATDLDSLEGIGNDFDGFYAFSQGNTVEDKGNTKLKKSQDELTFYIEQNAKIIANNSDNSIEITVDEESINLINYLNDNNLTVVGAEKINGQNKLVLTNIDEDMILLTFSDNWDLSANDLTNNQAIVSAGTKDFSILESVIIQDIDGDGITGSLDIVDKYYTIEENGELDLIYTEGGEYVIVDAAGNLTESNGLSDFINQGYNILGVENIESVNSVLVKNENMQYAIYESDEEWETFTVGNTYDFSSSSFDADIIENLEELFAVDIDQDNMIGASLDIDTQGSINLSLTSNHKILLTSEAETIVQFKNKELNSNKGIFKKFEILAAESINNTDSILVKYNESKNKFAHFIWELDEKGSFKKTFSNKINKNNVYEYEESFQYDINSDTYIGSNFMALEIGGDFELKKDSQGNIGIYNQDLNSTNYLYNKKGVLQSESFDKAHSIVGADVINGINSLVAVHNKNTNIKLIAYNADWTKQKKAKKYNSNQLFYFDIETALEQDLNNDSLIGIGYSTVESNGIILKEDTLGSAFVEEGDTLIGLTNKKGKALKSNAKKWDLFAATEYEDVNYIAYKKTVGSKFKIMKMNENWEVDKLFNVFSENNSSEIEYAETIFGQSFEV